MPRPPLSALIAPLSARVFQPKVQDANGHSYAPLMVEQEAAAEEPGVVDSPAMAEYKEIVKNATVIEDINVDCWGALFFVVVNDYPDARVGRISKVGKFRILFSLVVFGINLFIQFILLFYICKLLMMPGMLSAQDVYKHFTSEAFTNGEVDQQLFDSFSQEIKEEVCGLALSQALFARVVLFLWISTNIGELKGNYRKMNFVLGIPSLPDDLDMRLMVKDSPDPAEPSGRVVCLHEACKCLIMGFIFIPKFIICIFLTGTGCLWLMAAESIGDLILNSLALAFVVQVDELIALVFFPLFYLEDLSRLDLAGQAVSETDEAQEKRYMWNFSSSSFTLALTATIVELGLRFQPVIPSYNGRDVNTACRSFIESQLPWCIPGQMDCFPES